MVEILKLGNKTVVINGKIISLFKKGILLRQLYYGGYEDFDNANGGTWKKYIHIPITTVPHEDAVYKLVIDSENVSLYSADNTLKTSNNIASEFWSLVRADGYDVRVFDHLFRQLYFWTETFDYENQYAEIWIKLPANSKELNVAFANECADKSLYDNPNEVFIFFDDFNTFDSSKWATNTDTFSIQDSIIKFWGSWNENDLYFNTKQKFASPVVIIGRWKIGQVDADTDIFVGFRTTESGVFVKDGYDCIYDGEADTEYGQKRINKQTNAIKLGGKVTDTNWHKFRIIFRDNEIRFWDDLLGEISVSNEGLPEFYLSIGGDTDSTSRFGYIDYIAMMEDIDPASFDTPTIYEF